MLSHMCHSRRIKVLQPEWKQAKEQHSETPKCTNLPMMAALELYNFPQQLIFSKEEIPFGAYTLSKKCPRILSAPGPEEATGPMQTWLWNLRASNLSPDWESGRGCCRRGCIPNRSRHKQTHGSSQACSTLQSYGNTLKGWKSQVFLWCVIQKAGQAWLFRHIRNCHVKAHVLSV